MNRTFKVVLFVLLFVVLSTLIVALLSNGNLVVLNPKGVIALQERNLLVVTTVLMSLIVIPVFILTFAIAWRYRASNTKAAYTPDWEHSRTEEFIWWAVPCAIIFVLALVTWSSSHALDPFKPLASTTPPITIQVVALNWKWLFIYPEQKIATVNYVEFPVGTPVNFQITADAPMNSFWIPQLGGQIYAMAGMQTQLHIMANEAGTYAGSSANFSGAGFSGMQFDANAVTSKAFDQWVASVQDSPQALTLSTYDALSKPSQNNPPAYYASVSNNLFDTVVHKFMP